VHHIGAAVAPDVVDHLVGELGDDRRQVTLRQVDVPRGDVDDAVVRLDDDLAGEVGAPGSGVGGAVDAGVGQGGHQFAHVDVHPAAVTLARLDERRRVE